MSPTHANCWYTFSLSIKNSSRTTPVASINAPTPREARELFASLFPEYTRNTLVVQPAPTNAPRTLYPHQI